MSTGHQTGQAGAPGNPPEPRVAVFAPNPLLAVTLEREGSEREQVHFHPAGQGVWVARMAGCLGARPVLCGLIGGESGEILLGLLHGMHGEQRLVSSSSASGCYVTDRRSGEREILTSTLSDPPSRHELDDLISLTCVEAISDGWLLVTNPLPADALPLESYGDLVADARAGGARTIVDLSSPRLDSALRGAPDVVKLNDWELAEFVSGPVSEPSQLLGAARLLQERGAQAVIVTRGERPALVLDGEQAWLLTPPLLDPRLPRGLRGCDAGRAGGELGAGRAL